jgi:uncharacterized protein YqeY
MLMDTIRADLKTAMRSKDAVALRSLRAVITAVKEAEVAGSEATTLDDDGVQKVITSQVKRRVEAAEAFDAGGRPEKAADERAEVAVLERYLPAALTSEELDAVIDRVLADNGFTAKADMGKAMKAVNAEVAGRAEGREVADRVKDRLT